MTNTKTYPVALDVQSLLDLSNALHAMAAEYKETIPLGTKEQWAAWECLNDASTRLLNAAVHLNLHEDRTTRK